MDKLNKIKEKVLERYFETDETDETEDITYDDYQVQHEEIDISSVEESEPVEKIVAPIIVEKIAPAIISKYTVIEGNVKAENDLEVYGQVTGDVQSTGSVYIENAVITGNIAANEVVIKNSKIQGNIYSVSKVDLQAGTELSGDIKSKEVFVNGTCIGNIVAEKVAYFLGKVYLKGDVQTASIRIDEGAVIDGAIKVI
ncbi:MAG: polymer-forming cytoskeletal protein [Coprobacillus sp.]